MKLLNLIIKNKDEICLSLLWLFIIIIVNPVGDFPLNDDWCYAKSVKTLMEDGYLKLYNWGEMTLVAHVYWGYFFTSFFSFSFTVLRWSTLLLGGASIIGIYRLCKEMKTSRWIGIICALLCMVNPIFMGLSFSFMTDVPFYCITIWTFYFFIKALHTNDWLFLILAILFCCWAFLIRQIALVFPLAWMFSVLLTQKRTKTIVLKSLIPIFILAILYFGYTYVMKSEGILQERYNNKLYLLFSMIKEITVKRLINIFGYFFLSIAYIGFLLAPIHLFHLNKINYRKLRIWIVLFVLLITVILIYTGKAIPSLDNIWIDFGIGPTTLSDFSGNFTETPSPNAPKILWWFITLIGVLSSVVLLFKFKDIFQKFINRSKIDNSAVFSFLYFAIYATPFLIVGFYDRYLLALLPAVIIILCVQYNKEPSRHFKRFSLLFVFVMGTFSVCATHDYLSWNRTRWEVISQLKESGVRLDYIGGGVEYSTWYFFSEEDDRWWEKVVPVYDLVFHPEDNDKVIDTYPYKRWLPGEGKIYLIYNSDIIN